jgi:Na+-transporting methylmalonyl-CoA/oxaloacetate decarboxylase gamma subunit
MEFSTLVLTAVEAPNMFFVAAMGICTVLLGLTCIIFLCTLMSKICARTGGEANTPAPAPAPAVSQAAAPAPAPVSTEIPNRGELIAAVSAAIAEELGTDISRIRIRSLRRVGGAAVTADPARGELVAAIAAAAAEELGTDVSRIRIHSLKKIG